jgi:hypothetical protein
MAAVNTKKSVYNAEKNNSILYPTFPEGKEIIVVQNQ